MEVTTPIPILSSVSESEIVAISAAGHSMPVMGCTPSAARTAILIGAGISVIIACIAGERIANYARTRERDPKHDLNLHGLKLSAILVLAVFILIGVCITIGFAIDARATAADQAMATYYLAGAISASLINSRPIVGDLFLPIGANVITSTTEPSTPIVSP